MSYIDKRYSLPASIKRHLIGSENISKITNDYTDKLLDDALREIIGRPGKSAGKAEQSISASGTSAYNSSQMDGSMIGSGSGSVVGVGSGIIGAITSILGMVHADKAAKKAYERQNEFYENHISMPAKVSEFEQAGLNPMGLAGTGPGATSAPSVDSASTPSMDGITNLLGSILNYKLGNKQLDVEKYKADVHASDVASQIEYRSEQRIYQQKVNDWFEVNQQASLDKVYADTQDALQRVRTGQADEALKMAGYEKTQVEAALIAEQTLYEQWKNSPEWRNIELGLKRAQSNANNANAAHAYEDIKNLAVQRDNYIADTALKYAQTDKGRQELINLGYTEEQLKFAIEHQRGDLIYDRISKVAGAVKDVGIGIGAGASAATGGIKMVSTQGKTATESKTYGPDGTLKSTTRTVSGTKSTQGKK